MGAAHLIVCFFLPYTFVFYLWNRVFLEKPAGSGNLELATSHLYTVFSTVPMHTYAVFVIGLGSKTQGERTLLSVAVWFWVTLFVLAIVSISGIFNRKDDQIR